MAGLRNTKARGHEGGREGATKLDEAAIRRRFDERSLQRGRDYHRRRMVFDMRRQEGVLKARCRGTSAASYRVEATIKGGRIAEASCSCPVGDGGHCKHVVAMILTWQDKPEAFREIANVSESLANRPKQELIDLIELMLKRHPDLETLLELTPSADAVVESEVYQEKAAAALQGGFDSWGEFSPEDLGPAAEIAALRAIGDRFHRRGNHHSAVVVYRGILQGILQSGLLETGYGDELTDELISESSGVADLLADGLQHLDEDDAERVEAKASLLEWLKIDLRLGGIGLSTDAIETVIRTASEDERAELLDQLEELADEFGDGWADDYLSGLILSLEEAQLDDEAYLKRCRQLGQVMPLVDRLLALGRTEEVVAAAKKASDYDLCPIADRLVKHDCADEALRLVRSRLRNDNSNWQLESWLERYTTSSDDWTGATDIAWKRFKQQPFLEHYHLLREYARQAETWPKWQPKAIAHAERKAAPSEFLRILLAEGRIKEVVERLQSLRTKSVPLELRRKIAREAEATLKDQALALHWENSELLILQRGRDNYRAACEDLDRIRELHRQLGRSDEWKEAIEGLRQEHRRLRALQEEMDDAGV